MKNYIVIVVLLIVKCSTLFAAGRINFAAADFQKRLYKSTVNPIDLYKSTDANHNNKFFTTKVVTYLEKGGLPAGMEASLRNEVCAAQAIQTAAATAAPAIAFARTPGPIGFYKHNESVVAVYDGGLAGERLDTVLLKFKNADIVNKTLIATRYALEMVRNLNAIHAANITVNDVSLRNFYVRPDGSLTVVDFSSAKSSPAGMDAIDKKDERVNLLADGVRSMYEILFLPAGPDNAYTKFLAIPGLPALWRTTDFTQMAFAPVAAGVGAPTYALSVHTDTGVLDLVGAGGLLTRAEHDGTGFPPGIVYGVNGFVVDPNVTALTKGAPGNVPFATLALWCNGW